MANAVLLDSGFLIRLMNPDEPLHPLAMRWFRCFVERGIQCKVSTIALAEYGNISRFFHWDGTVILLRIPVNAPEGFNYINYLE